MGLKSDENILSVIYDVQVFLKNTELQIILFAKWKLAIILNNTLYVRETLHLSQFSMINNFLDKQYVYYKAFIKMYS